MLSIIIPTLNEEKYLPLLFASLGSQEFRNYEIIIVDGGSTDNTLPWCMSTKERLGKSWESIIMKIEKLPVSNVSLQKNHGAGIASGTYLAFIDADIILQNDRFLGHIMHMLGKKGKNGKGYVGATCNLAPDPGSVNGFVKPFFFSGMWNGTVDILNGWGFPVARGGIQFYNRELFLESGGFPERTSVGEDIILSRRMASKGRIHYCRKISVFESHRRYESEGYVFTTLRWVINGVWWYLFNRPFSGSYKMVR